MIGFVERILAWRKRRRIARLRKRIRASGSPRAEIEAQEFVREEFEESGAEFQHRKTPFMGVRNKAEREILAVYYAACHNWKPRRR